MADEEAGAQVLSSLCKAERGLEGLGEVTYLLHLHHKALHPGLQNSGNLESCLCASGFNFAFLPGSSRRSIK